MQDIDLINPTNPIFAAEHPQSTGTVDDDDDPADENELENEAPVRETRDVVEAPEEFDLEDDDASKSDFEAAPGGDEDEDEDTDDDLDDDDEDDDDEDEDDDEDVDADDEDDA